MGRKRKDPDQGLPSRVYLRRGTFFYAHRDGKWENLGKDLAAAQDALVTAMDFYVEGRRTVPQPTAAKRGEHWVELPPSVTAKVLLLNRMIELRLRPVDLATRMGVRPQEVTRLLDLQHATKIDTLAAAIKATGAELQLSVV